jgi:hypothetical protein
MRHWRRVKVEETVAAVKEVGAQNFILATDHGQTGNPGLGPGQISSACRPRVEAVRVLGKGRCENDLSQIHRGKSLNKSCPPTSTRQGKFLILCARLRAGHPLETAIARCFGSAILLAIAALMCAGMAVCALSRSALATPMAGTLATADGNVRPARG